MDRLHSLTELSEHFDTTVTVGSSRDHERTLRPLKAYPDELPIGSIIDMDARLLVKDYKKNSDLRPGLVTALWHDAAGTLKKIELAGITTQTGKIYTDNLLLDNSERLRDFRRNKVACVNMHSTYIADNTTEFFPRTVRKVFEIPESYWPDLVLRRADAVLHNANLRAHVQGSIAGLVRTGFSFPTIKDENIPSRDFVPEVMRGGFAREPWTLMEQFEINRLARFAEYYVWSNPKAVAETHRFPPSDTWPERFPNIPFRKHDKTRGYALPVPA